MIINGYTDECVCCSNYCIHCGLDHVPTQFMVCDNCKETSEELYKTKDDEDLCFSCYIERYKNATKEELNAAFWTLNK